MGGSHKRGYLPVCCSGNLVTFALWAVMTSIWTSPAVTARSSRVFTGHLTLTVVASCHASLSLDAVARGVYLSAFFFFISGCHFDDRLSPPTLWMPFHSPVLSGCFDRHLEMCCLWQPASKMPFPMIPVFWCPHPELFQIGLCEQQNLPKRLCFCLSTAVAHSRNWVADKEWGFT